MSNIYVAFYKHKRPLNSWQNICFRFFDEVIRLFTHGKYSHCEVVMPNFEKDGDLLFECYSASNRDGGVRLKLMPLPVERWDLIKVNVNPALLRLYFKQTKGSRYDMLGAIGVVLPVGENKHKYFCSEWCAGAIGLANPHKYSPNSLYRKLKEKV